MSDSRIYAILDHIGQDVRNQIQLRNVYWEPEGGHQRHIKFEYTPRKNLRRWFTREPHPRPMFCAGIAQSWDDRYIATEYVVDLDTNKWHVIQCISGLFWEDLDDALLRFTGYRDCKVHRDLMSSRAAAARTKPQATLFDDIDTLPLMSGTAVRVQSNAGQRQAPVGRQLSMAKCATCKDTGKVGDRFCWCQAGKFARQVEKEMKDVEEQAHDLSQWHRAKATKGRISSLEF